MFCDTGEVSYECSLILVEIWIVYGLNCLEFIESLK